MPTTEAQLDLLILEDLEFNLACEGRGHPSGNAGHTPADPATHYSQCPNCKATVLLCASQATWLRSFQTNHCEACGTYFPPNIHRIPGK